MRELQGQPERPRADGAILWPLCRCLTSRCDASKRAPEDSESGTAKQWGQTLPKNSNVVGDRKKSTLFNVTQAVTCRVPWRLNQSDIHALLADAAMEGTLLVLHLSTTGAKGLTVPLGICGVTHCTAYP